MSESLASGGGGGGDGGASKKSKEKSYFFKKKYFFFKIAHLGQVPLSSAPQAEAALEVVVSEERKSLERIH